MRMTTISQDEMEQLDIGILMAELQGALAMANMAEAKQNAATATIARLRGQLAETLKNHKAAGGHPGDEPTQAMNYRQRITEASGENFGLVEEARKCKAFAGSLREELGHVEQLWKKAKGKQADVMKWVGEIVEEAIDTAPADRDAAEKTHQKTEEMRPQAVGESDRAYKEKVAIREDRQQIRGPIAPEAYYATVVHQLRVKFGKRIARLAQARMWEEDLIKADGLGGRAGYL